MEAFLSSINASLIVPLMSEWQHPAFWVAISQIIGIDILLAGDNAVVIALACRMLPPKQRMWGMILGAGVAILMRVFFTLVISQALALPFLKLVGGLLLIWIAVKLLAPEQEEIGEDKIKGSSNLWSAVRVVAIADIVMSLDNVIAIAAAAETAAGRIDPLHAEAIKSMLIVFGLAASVPLIVAGSALVITLLLKFPILVWFGAGLLGWIAGDIILKDPIMLRVITPEDVQRWHYVASVAGAAIVVAIGLWIRRNAKARVEAEV